MGNFPKINRNIIEIVECLLFRIYFKGIFLKFGT